MDMTMPMADLPVGESGHVTRISTAPDMSRRLADLGLIPGTRVTCVSKSPAGDPCAYLIRGAVIALRRSDSERIALERGEALAAARSAAMG